VSSAASAGGFTLLELLLSVTLLAMLALVSIGVWWGTLAEADTRENINRITSLLRSARAEAARAGRRCRLTFDEQTGQPLLTVETDPLADPGIFQKRRPWWVKQAQLQAGVRVLTCRRVGDSAFARCGRPESSAGEDDQAAFDELDFYPDGTSDSARIVLTNNDEEKPWTVEITLNGLDGAITAREIDPEAEPIE